MNGLDCFFTGFRLIRQAGLRQYVIIPTLINVVVLFGLVLFSISSFDGWVNRIVGFLPEWASFLSWLVSLVAFIVVAFTLLIVFTIVANLIASPFNALLATRVEESLVPGHRLPDVALALTVPKALWREVSKLLYLLPRLIALLIFSLIPLLNTAAPVLWLLFGAWMMAIQYSDYAADNNDVPFEQLRNRLGHSRFQAILFGLPVYMLLAVPLLNLILIPAAVAGGTAFWVNHLTEESNGDR